jgi:hypothetical protein
MTMTKFENTVKPGDWKGEVLEQLEYHWGASFRPRMEGLTDEEYFWEPAPGCWSIRPRGQAASRMAAGKGDFVIDFEFPDPDPAPVTTIAWRLVHIIAVFGHRAANHFRELNPALLDQFVGSWWETFETPGTAAGALAVLDKVHDAWIAGLRTLDDDAVWRVVGPDEGPFQDFPYASLMLHINREYLHHSAEVLLLRDLYRAEH